MDEVHNVSLCIILTCINLVQDTSEKYCHFDIIINFNDLLVLLLFHVCILYYCSMLDLLM